MFVFKNLRFMAIMILIFGLGSAVAIYLIAEPTPVNPFEYDLLTSKKYIRELELYGGKFNVLATEFNQWFVGLWHGKSLAFTIGIISLSLSSLLWFIDTPRHPNHDADAHSNTNHNRFSA